jgi:membrane fusion protein, multidrug efflux system
MDGYNKKHLLSPFPYWLKMKINKNKIMNRLLPFFLFLGLLAACSSGTDKNKPEENKAPAPHLQLAIVEKNGVSSTVKLPAQLAAFQQVSIFPKVNGYVKTVLVDIGSKVSRGSLLMVLEAPELQEAALQAKEKYARARADFSMDREHYARLLEASATPGAISPLDLSTIRSKMEADSALSNAEKNNWQMQETMQGYLRVIAPFDGIITERNVHPGALVSAEAKDSKPMLELKEITRLRLEVDIPEGNTGSLKDGDTITFYTSAFPGRRMTGFISRQARNVDPQFRSERVEIDVNNKDGILSPGMYADVVLEAKGNTNAFSVPGPAVVISTERKYLILVRNGRTVKTDVSTGNQASGRTEVYGHLQAGDTVVVNASDEIPEGMPVP